METRKGQSASLKRVRSVNYQDVDAAMIIWFPQLSENPQLRIDGIMLHRKANDFARAFGKDPKITSTWVDR